MYADQFDEGGVSGKQQKDGMPKSGISVEISMPSSSTQQQSRAQGGDSSQIPVKT